jgi:hypothetical protein
VPWSARSACRRLRSHRSRRACAKIPAFPPCRAWRSTSAFPWTHSSGSCHRKFAVYRRIASANSAAYVEPCKTPVHGLTRRPRSWKATTFGAAVHRVRVRSSVQSSDMWAKCGPLAFQKQKKPPRRDGFPRKSGSRSWTRTNDPLINSQPSPLGPRIGPPTHSSRRRRRGTRQMAAPVRLYAVPPGAQGSTTLGGFESRWGYQIVHDKPRNHAVFLLMDHRFGHLLVTDGSQRRTRSCCERTSVGHCGALQRHAEPRSLPTARGLSSARIRSQPRDLVRYPDARRAHHVAIAAAMVDGACHSRGSIISTPPRTLRSRSSVPTVAGTFPSSRGATACNWAAPTT